MVPEGKIRTENETPEFKLYNGGAIFILPPRTRNTPGQYASEPFVHDLRLTHALKTRPTYKPGGKIPTGTEQIGILPTHPAEVIIFLLRRSGVIGVDKMDGLREVLASYYGEFVEFMSDDIDQSRKLEALQAAQDAYPEAALLTALPDFIEGVFEYHPYSVEEFTGFLGNVEMFAKYVILREQSISGEED